MKFRIRKEQFDSLSKLFDKKDSPLAEINLELVPDTATEAIIHQQIEAKAYHKGYHYGFKVGYHEGQKKENYRCTCGCGGNNCYDRLCDEFCQLLNN